MQESLIQAILLDTYNQTYAVLVHKNDTAL